MKLKQLFESKFLTDRDEIVTWVNENLYDENGKEITEDKIQVDGSGKVVLSCGLTLHPGMKRLEVQFKSVSGPVRGDDAELETFEGCPEYVLWAKYAGTMRTLEGITKRAEKIDFHKCHNIVSLEGVHKHIEQCKTLILPPTIKSNILGLIKIKDLEQALNVVYVANAGPGVAPGLRDALNIINRHLAGDRSIIKAQRELIDADLDEFA